MTDRALTSGMASALVNARPIFFYQGEFTGGTLRLCSEPYDVTWNGETWVAGGQLLSVSKVTESPEIKAVGFQVSLDGCRPTIAALALAQCRQGQTGTVWIGLWDDAHVIVPDPYLAYEGRLDVPDIVLDGAIAKITISYESRIIDLERPRERRVTDEDQRLDYPSDRGREYIASLQDKVISF